jgi:hypothetical protein
VNAVMSVTSKPSLLLQVGCGLLVAVLFVGVAASAFDHSLLLGFSVLLFLGFLGFALVARVHPRKGPTARSPVDPGDDRRGARPPMD